MKSLFTSLCLFGLGLSGLPAQDAKKVIFISGKPSHGPGAHEHRAGNILLAKRLNEANLGIEAIVLPENGYPKDPKVLEDAATVVIFCTGHNGHLLNPHLYLTISSQTDFEVREFGVKSKRHFVLV